MSSHYDDECMSYYYSPSFLRNKYSNLSEPADKFIQSLSSDEKLIAFHENLEHDGFDRYGPESDLWDLNLITKKGSDYIYYSLHWENWFRGEKKEYELECRRYLKNMVSNSYHWNIIKNLVENNSELRRFVNSVDNSFYRKSLSHDYGVDVIACHTSDKYYFVLNKVKYTCKPDEKDYSVTLYNKSDKSLVETIPYSEFKKKYFKLRCLKWFRKSIKLNN
jgi:hypothetical protein